MVHRNWISLGGVLGLALLLMGCSSVTVKETDEQGNPVAETEMSSTDYNAREDRKLKEKAIKQIGPAVSACDPDLTEMAETLCEAMRPIRMLFAEKMLDSVDNDQHWAYKAAKLDFWGRIVAGPASALLQPFANRLAYGKRGSAYGGGGYTELNFGNRIAKGGGSGGGDKGVVGGASASGDSSFENIQINTGNKSPWQTGSGVLAGGKDSQIQEGDGTQGQVITRPITQPQPSTEGGDLNNDSTGFTGAETGDIGL